MKVQLNKGVVRSRFSPPSLTIIGHSAPERRKLRALRDEFKEANLPYHTMRGDHGETLFTCGIAPKQEVYDFAPFYSTFQAEIEREQRQKEAAEKKDDFPHTTCTSFGPISRDGVVLDIKPDYVEQLINKGQCRYRKPRVWPWLLFSLLTAVTGCDKVSPGCDNCYALAMSKRLQVMGLPQYQDVTEGDNWTGRIVMNHARLEEPLRWTKPRMVFVNSMSDLFHPRVSDEFIKAVFRVMLQADRHTFQVLTKRSKRLKRLSPKLDWPPHVWMGVSCESQEYLYRVRDLSETSAAVKFVSCEPLLGELWMCPLPDYLSGLDWVIVGGESGPGARPMHPDWVRSIRDQCAKAGVPFFFKQWGAWVSVSEVAGTGEHFHFPDGVTVRRIGKKLAGRTLDGVVHDAMPERGRN